MSLQWRCLECGGYCFHFTGCPEDVGPDEDATELPDPDVEPKEPNYDLPRPLSALDNYNRNHRRNVP